MNRDKEIKEYLEGKLSGEENMKYEIAEELGLLDKVLESGWKSLSAKRNRTNWRTDDTKKKETENV